MRLDGEMQMKKTYLKWRMTAMAAALAALSACGGGGGGGGSETTQVDGSAIKGNILNADVQLIELANNSLDPAQGKVIGSSQIGAANALFSVPVTGYSGGAVVIRIKGRPATAMPRTRVQCDFRRPGPDNDCGNVEFGGFVDVDDSFVIESFLPALARNSSNRMNATALTALLRSRAATLLSGSETREAIRRAITQINQLARANVVTDTPVNLNAPIPESAAPEQVAYAALNAAVLSQAPAGATGQAALTGAITSLNNAFTENNSSIPKEVVRDLVDAARDVLPAGQAGAAGVLMDLEMSAQGEGNFNLPPQPAGNTTAIQRARSFIGNVRNTAQRYGQLPSLDESGFATQLEAAGDFADVHAVRLFEDVGGLVAAVGDALDENPQLTSFAYGSRSSGNVQKTANVTFTRANGNTTARVAGQPVGDATVDLTLVFPTALDGATGVTNNITLSGNAQTTASLGAVLTINEGSASVTSKNGQAPIEDDQGQAGENIDRISLDLKATLAQKGVSNPVSFVGTIGATAVQCVGATCSATPESVAATPTRLLLKGTVSGSAGQLFEGGIEVTVPETSARKFNATQDYSATNFIEGSIVVSGRAKVTNFPEGLLTVAVDSKGYSNSAEVPIGKVLVSLSENGRLVLRVSSENTAQQPDFTALVLENADGVRLTLNNVAENPSQNVQVRGDLFVDGQKAGRVEQSGSGLVRVVYDDGTFESLFF